MDEDAEDLDDGAPPSGVAVKRACDVCRARKIRCDKLSPCSHCRAVGMTCRTSSLRSREPRSRVVISKEYENKIDRMESRLSGIENLLRQALDSLSSIEKKETRSSVNTPVSSLNSQVKVSASVPQDAFEGFTSTNAQSQVATNVMEQTLGQDPSVWQNAQLDGALRSLRDLAGKMKTSTANLPANARASIVSDDAAETTPGMLPAQDVRDLLDKICSETTFAFTIFLPFLSTSSFAARCERWHANPEDASPTLELLVSGCFYSLCCELSATQTADSVAQHYYRLGLICEKRLEKAFACANLMMPASRDNIEGLIAAASAAIDMCKPSICFVLNSAAATLAQNLGYHRYSTMADDAETEKQDKIMLFWTMYQLDKSTSLRLGRAPTIQDFDISLPYPASSPKMPQGMATLFAYWLDVSRVQGQVNEKLYSPGALSKPQDERFRCAAQLEAELDAAYAKRLRIVRPLGPGKEVGVGLSLRESYEDILINSDDVIHYSSMALVQYAKPVTQANPSPALGAARKALRLFHDLTARNSVNDYFWVSYCHWIIMNCPFTPFMVLFCHLISSKSSTESESDLGLISNFVSNLQTASHLSDGVNKLFQLCAVFCNVAESYVKRPTHPANALGEFDNYLSSLGFAPPTVLADSAEAGAANDFSNAVPAADQDLTGYLQDWYSGNVSLLGLLEQDLGSGFANDMSYSQLNE